MAGQLTAGTVVTTTLSDGTNSTSATNPIRGSAKAWVNFNGGSATIYSAYNVSSVTRNAVGNYSMNFTTAFASTAICCTMSSNDNGSGAACLAIVLATGTTSFQILTINPASLGISDSAFVGASFFQ